MKPLLSVVIPVFNDRRGYLRELMDDLHAQTFASWEAVIVDDGSTEGLDVAAVSSATGDSRFRSVRHAVNRGLSAARNTGVAAAVTDRLVLADSDDRLQPEYLATLHAAAERHPACDGVFTDYYLFGARQESCRFVPGEPGSERILALRERLEDHFVKGRPLVESALWSVDVRNLDPSLKLRFLLPPAGCLLNRQLLERTAGFCENSLFRKGLEDWDFWLSGAAAGARVVHVSRELYGYRQHAASMISGVARHEAEIRELLVDRHHALLQQLGLRDAVLACGYRRSAKAALLAGDVWNGGRLGMKALRLSPRHFFKAIAGRVSMERRTEEKVYE